MTDVRDGESQPVRIEKLVAGGDGLARQTDGRVLFVSGALPGELVRVGKLDERKDFARGTALEVVEPSLARVEPPCPHVPHGCGACDLQYADPARQPDLKAEVVRDALRRLGRRQDPVVVAGPTGPSDGYRTTVRCLVEAGRAGFRRRASHDMVPVDSCLVAHPGIEELIAEGVFEGVDEVTLRIGARTGERLVVASPSAAKVRVPDGVQVVGADQLRAGAKVFIHEEAAGRTWRVSARSFFQASAWGADALADQVLGDVLDGADPPRRVADLYGGVGLFAGALATRLEQAGGAAPEVTLVESSRSAIDDARHNLADLDGMRVTRRRVEAWTPRAVGAVIADPARTGLGLDGVARISGTGCSLLVLVSCDAASLGRDTRLLTEAGFGHVRSTSVDLFPQTSHVEVVSRFELGTPPGT